MRRLGLAGCLLVFALVSAGAPLRMPVRPAHADGDIIVTSAGDSGGSGGAICPHATLCTLRRAIESANADASGGEYRITFSPTIFPPAAHTPIEVGNTALPTISRDGVTIDGAGAGVTLIDAATSLTAKNNGITVTGTGFTLRNVNVRGFRGSCVAVTGAGAAIGAPSAGNVVGGCPSGIAVSGADATIRGNLIGFTPEGAADEVDTGIVVAGSGIVVGGPASTVGAGNRIGFAATGIFVGSGDPAAIAGIQVERNILGRRPSGEPAALTVAILLSQPSGGTTISTNTITNAVTGIAVSPDANGVPVTKNRFVANLFDGIDYIAIDLGFDGVRNPNDPGDADMGPNGLLNSPVISRATQTRISGTACALCQVQLYVAVHSPGGEHDYGLAPLVAGTVSADANGLFALDNPAAGPGDWLTALATDADGNTSEFSPSARVGAGSVLCGNVQLHAGWNHVGYFGSEPVALLSSFTPVPSGAVTAIYRFVDGTDQFERWFSATTVGRTLTSVEPGESYWFYAEAPATLPGGFSLSFPLPLQLKAGWNDVVYLGASETVADALGSLNNAFHDLYRYDNSEGGWLRFGTTTVPSWAQQFDRVEACGVYQLRLEAPATLVPLQP